MFKPNQSSQVTWHDAEYDLNGQPQSVEFCLSPEPQGLKTRDSELPLAVVIGGLGETRDSIARTVGALKVVRAVGMFAEFPDSSPESIEQTAVLAPVAVAEEAQAITGSWQKPNVFGGSLGGGVAIKTFHDAPETWASAGLITPFGFNNELLGESVRDRQKQVIRRVRTHMKGAAVSPTDQAGQTDQPDPTDSIGQVDQQPEFSLSNFMATSAYGLQQDAAKLLDGVYSKARLAILLTATEDPIFPPNEIATVLESYDLEEAMHIVEGQHYTPGSDQAVERITFAARVIAKASSPSLYPEPSLTT